MNTIEVLLTEIKLQHDLRLEHIKADKAHVASSWIKTKTRLISNIKTEHPHYQRDVIDTVENFD